MQVAVGRACGKAILFGEHAVVYGRPAIGVPLTSIFAEAQVREGTGGVAIVAEDLDQAWMLEELTPEHPLAHIVRATLRALNEETAPNFLLTLRSTIPVARGLGSGTAVSTAIVRALAQFYGSKLSPAQVSTLVFETEKLYHGTPSGVDNTIIAFEQPVYHIKGQAPVRLKVARPFQLTIGDTGALSETKLAVGAVRTAWESDPKRYERIFDAIGSVVGEARDAIEFGRVEALGGLMDRNQEQLRALGVSSPALERLIDAAKRAGADGAKLSGAGRGGSMLAIAREDVAQAVDQALRAAGAHAVLRGDVAQQT
jgi:mevalonate kinase